MEVEGSYYNMNYCAPNLHKICNMRVKYILSKICNSSSGVFQKLNSYYELFFN